MDKRQLSYAAYTGSLESAEYVSWLINKSDWYTLETLYKRRLLKSSLTLEQILKFTEQNITEIILEIAIQHRNAVEEIADGVQSLSCEDSNVLSRLDTANSKLISLQPLHGVSGPGTVRTTIGSINSVMAETGETFEIVESKLRPGWWNRVFHRYDRTVTQIPLKEYQRSVVINSFASLIVQVAFSRFICPPREKVLDELNPDPTRTEGLGNYWAEQFQKLLDFISSPGI